MVLNDKDMILKTALHLILESNKSVLPIEQ